MELNATTLSMLWDGSLETIYMVALSSAISYLIGVPLGILLIVTDKDGIRPVPAFNRVLGLAINLLRSIPFIILVISASPYIARMVESSLKEVNAGVIEAAKSMGASTMQIIWKVLLPEAKPSLLVGAAISITTILGYSTMAGYAGGGGLGDIAIRYGFYRYETEMMLVTVVLLVIIVQLIQIGFMHWSRGTDKRIR